MTALFIFMMGFFAWRAFVYFKAERPIAGVAASLAVMLFAGNFVVDYLVWEQESSAASRVARSGVEATPGGSQASDGIVIGDYDPNRQ